MKSIIIVFSLFISFQLTSQVVINELVASNVSTASDQDEEFDDWIELYNNGSSAVNLSGYFLSDNPENHGKWEFPEGTEIGANGYLIIWADEDGSQEGLHASFKLAKSGEEINLSNQDTIPFETVVYGEQEVNMAFARQPNGTGSFVTKGATFNANNDTSSNTDEHPIKGFKMYPNPCTTSLTISHEAKTPVIFKILDSNGAIISEQTISNKSIIDVAQWPVGTYFLASEQFYVPLVKQ